MSAGPYSRAAWLYRGAGWSGVLPLPPAAKWPPPGGYTGWTGVEPSGADVQAWCDGSDGAGNIALRLPRGTYGLDVDAYGGKRGGEALAAAEANLGPLPATWRVSARDDGVSGIRLYRAELAPGRRWRDEPAGHGAGIEAIHFGHRYAVAWPSVHPDTGREYVWYRPDGGGVAGPDEVPRLDGLPELPAAWVEALSEPGDVATGEAASHADTLAALDAMPAGEPCARMTEARARALARLRSALDGAALHPAARDATHEIVALGHEGHAGARRTLAEHYGAFTSVRVGRGGDQRAAEGEWWRMVRGAVGKLPASSPRESCDCALLAGDGVTFEWSEGAALEESYSSVTSDDDTSGGEGGAGGLVDVLRARLLTPAQVRELRPPAAVVEGLLTLDSESWLIAKPGSFKSFVALDVAGHVAAGKPWMGRAVIQGPVLYLAAEGAGGMGKRVRAWEQRNGEMAGVHFLPIPIQAAREDHWAALVELGRQLRPVLIVLDTQARITVGLNENDNSDMGRFVDALGQLRRATAACVLVVHHLGRSGQDARGASAIDGAQDSELRLTRTAERRVVLQTDKQRHLPDDVRVELELFDCALDDGSTSLVVGTPLGAVALPDWRANLSANQGTLIEVMIDIFPAIGATKAELKAEAIKRPRRLPDGRGEAPMGDSSFRRAWDALVDSGRFVRVEGTQRYIVDSTSMDGEMSE